MFGGGGAGARGVHRGDGVVALAGGLLGAIGGRAGALERVVGLGLRGGRGGLGLFAGGEGVLGDFGGLDACSLFGRGVLFGAADLGMRVRAHGGELGLELLDVGEDLQRLQAALEVVGEALRDAAKRHGGEADGPLAAVVTAARGVVIAAAPAARTERGLGVVLGEVAVARWATTALGRRRDRPDAAREAARLLVVSLIGVAVRGHAELLSLFRFIVAYRYVPCNAM